MYGAWRVGMHATSRLLLQYCLAARSSQSPRWASKGFRMAAALLRRWARRTQVRARRCPIGSAPASSPLLQRPWAAWSLLKHQAMHHSSIMHHHHSSPPAMASTG